jgi:hypothetical protein
MAENTFQYSVQLRVMLPFLLAESTIVHYALFVEMALFR